MLVLAIVSIVIVLVVSMFIGAISALVGLALTSGKLGLFTLVNNDK